MNGSAAAVRALLVTAGRCEREMHAAAAAFRAGYDLGPGAGMRSQLILERSRVPAGIEVLAEVWLPVDDGVNEISFSLTVDVTGTGLRVASSLAAHLDAAMGECGPGSHTFHARRSDVRGFDAAMAEARAQASAFRTLAGYPGRLGLRPSGA